VSSGASPRRRPSASASRRPRRRRVGEPAC
jgi:hypothetical protein